MPVTITIEYSEPTMAKPRTDSPTDLEPDPQPPSAKPSESARSSAPAEPDPNQLMTTLELMDYLNILRTKVWELVRAEKPPLSAFKLGGDYHYRRAEVYQFSRKIQRQTT